MAPVRLDKPEGDLVVLVVERVVVLRAGDDLLWVSRRGNRWAKAFRPAVARLMIEWPVLLAPALLHAFDLAECLVG